MASIFVPGVGWTVEPDVVDERQAPQRLTTAQIAVINARIAAGSKEFPAGTKVLRIEDEKILTKQGVGGAAGFFEPGSGPGTVDWGLIGGAITDQADLVAVFESISAAGYSGNYNDLINKPTIPQGDVVGPASSVNNRVAFFSGTTGKLLADSGLTLSGTNTGDQTSVSGNAGTATALQNARTIDGVSFNGTANITVIAPAIFAATAKTTPVDADTVGITDSAASNVLKKVTWANIKATLKTYLDTLYVPIPAAWTSSALVVTAGSGTITTKSGTIRYLKEGRKVTFTLSITITTNGTGAGAVITQLPFAAAGETVCAGEEFTTGKAVTGYVAASSTQLEMVFYDVTYPGADGRRVIVSGTYESTT